jgi:hypothetical protein
MIKLQKILQEASKTGVMTGTQEKGLSTGLRVINTKYADQNRDYITPQTPHSEINYGGCGIFAKLLYYNLRKYLSITPDIICFDFPVVDPLPQGGINKYKSLQEFNWSGYTCVHLALKIKDYYIDSSGVHKLRWFTNQYNMDLVEHTGMSIQTLTSWVATGDDWNFTFDRYTIGDINKDLVTITKQLASN